MNMISTLQTGAERAERSEAADFVMRDFGRLKKTCKPPSEPSKARRARRLTSVMRDFKGTMQSMMHKHTTNTKCKEAPLHAPMFENYAHPVM